MVVVLIQFTGLLVLGVLLCPDGRRQVPGVAKRMFNGVAVGAVVSTCALFIVIVVLSLALSRMHGSTQKKHFPVFASLQQIPSLDLFHSIFHNPATYLNTSTEPEKKKYVASFPAPHHLDVFFDYDEGLSHAQRVDKPILLHFTGRGCAESRKIEADVWSDPDVLGYLHNEYVVIQLYVDDNTSLPLNEHTVSPHTRKTITTAGSKWADIQASRFSTDAQPYYVVLSTSGKELVQGTGAEYDIDAYAQFLAAGLKTFHARPKSIL